MISTSQAYKDLMMSPVMESRMVVTIFDGTNTTTLTDRDLVAGTFTINWRSSNNRTLCLGTTYAASLSFSAFKQVNTVVEGQYLVVTPTIYYNIGGGNEEVIPLGVFRCDSPVNFKRTTDYECYDFMLALDEMVTSRFTGTPYNLLNFICSECGVTLGNTSQQIGAMVNGSQLLVIDPKSVRTYRDAVSYISIILGGYCQFGRDGKFYVRQFHQTADMTLPRKRRTTATSFAGYHTQFCGVTCRFLADQNYYPYDYNNPEMDVGIIMDLGDIPVVEDTIRNKQIVLQNIYSAIQNLEYYPCDITYAGDASIEAGDMLATPDAAGYLKNVMLTSVTFDWRRDCQLLSEGANPKMGKVTTEAKKTSNAISNVSQNNAVITSTFVNPSAITVGSSAQQEITNLKFVTNKDLTAIFGAEIPVQSSGDGYVEITYVDSGIDGDVVKARVHEGYNLITLVNHLHYDSGRVVLLQLKAKTEGIGSGSAPTLTISQDTIRSYVFAQGIETDAQWDGIISITDSVDYVEAVLALYGITDGVVVSTYVPIDDALTDIIAAATAALDVYGITEDVSIGLEYGDQILRMGQGHRAGAGRMLAPISVV